MTGGAGGAALAGDTPIRLTSITSIDKHAKTLFSFIRYSPQSIELVGLSDDKLAMLVICIFCSAATSFRINEIPPEIGSVAVC
jgi:hypothetical protein